MPVRTDATKHSTVTLRDVALEAGVHPGTVSRALNEETRALVNDQTAARILRAAEQLGYRPNPLARGLRTKRSYTIGVLVPDLTNPLFPPIVRGIEERLDERGYTPLIANTDNSPARERTAVAAMLARHVDGLIAATAHRGNELLDEVPDPEMPVVLVNRSTDDRSLPAVTVDDRLGIHLAVEHLVSLGHRRIAHIAGAQRLSTGRRRYESYLSALNEYGLERDDAIVRFSKTFSEAEGARLCRSLFDSGEEFSAVVAGNDLIALGCYDALEERGLSCPRDLSIVGFNDMPFAAHFNPPLTTVRIPHYELGTRAAMIMLERLQNPDGPVEFVQLNPELVVRDSTRAIL